MHFNIYQTLLSTKQRCKFFSFVVYFVLGRLTERPYKTVNHCSPLRGSIDDYYHTSQG